MGLTEHGENTLPPRVNNNKEQSLKSKGTEPLALFYTLEKSVRRKVISYTDALGYASFLMVVNFNV